MNIILSGIILNSLFITQALAEPQDLKEIKKLENMQQKKTASKITRPRVEYSADKLRDPFQGAVSEQGVGGPGTENAASSLSISGIVSGEKMSQAIINGKVVKVGDTIEGFNVIDINLDGVTVSSGSFQYVVPAPAGAIRKPKTEGGKNEK